MYDLAIQHLATHTVVTVTGDLNPTTDLAIDAEIRAACESAGASYVLIDIRPAGSRLSVLDNHVAATTFRERMGPAIRAVAIVDHAAFLENSEMYELTSTNRGAQLRFFDNPRAAIDWLVQLGDVRKEHDG